jgi:hypothetical protein
MWSVPMNVSLHTFWLNVTSQKLLETDFDDVLVLEVYTHKGNSDLAPVLQYGSGPSPDFLAKY